MSEYQQIVSKKRVTEHGEVFTAPREVNAMLDLVKKETERIESKFLEPSCGKGAFLKEILNRKLKVVAKKYSNSLANYTKYSLIAVSSIYGIDILESNINDCRTLMLDIFRSKYMEVFNKSKCPQKLEAIVKFILKKNLVCGNTLTYERMDKIGEPIIFSEWSITNINNIKREDFYFKDLVESSSDNILQTSRQSKKLQNRSRDYWEVDNE